MNISQIEIFIHTSIPNYKEPIKLTKSIIYHPSYKEPNDLNEYPFITDTVRYPVNELRRMKDYSKIVKFFFNIKYFKEKLSGLVFKVDKPLKSTVKESILKSNIMSMLSLLFPTSFPNKNNLYSSFETYILQNYNTNFSFSLKNTIFTNYKFSYLSINSKKYTITKVVWLNDVYNNPVYKKFIGDFINFNDKLSNESIRIDNIIERKIKTLYTHVISNDYQWDEESIKKVLFNNIIWFPKDGTYDKTNITNTNTYTEDEYNEYFNKYFNTKKIEDILKNTDYLKIAMYGDMSKIYSYNDSQSKEEKFIKKMSFFKNIFKINDYIKNLEKILPNIETTYDLSLRTNDAFEIISNIPQKKKQNYRKVMDDIKNIYTYKIIKEKYMREGNININIKDEEEFIVNKLKSEFKLFINFIENINQILPGQKESTNEKLQQMINDYSTKSSNKDSSVCGFGDTMNYIYYNFVKRISYAKQPTECSNILDENHFYTGLTKINNNDFDKPQYEAHIHINLIEGELTPNNINKFICNYKGLYLGKELEHIVVNYNKYDVLEDSLFFKLDEKLINSQEINKPKSQGGKNTSFGEGVPKIKSEIIGTVYKKNTFGTSPYVRRTERDGNFFKVDRKKIHVNSKKKIKHYRNKTIRFRKKR